jgi:hypothetical protein
MASCTNVYYNTNETVHNKEKAIEMINAFKRGTLVIQIPCDRKKLEVLENKATNETDKQKKVKYLEEFEKQKQNLNFIQTSMMEAAKKQFTFSKYVFLPDTAVLAFKNGQRDDIFIDDSFEFVNDIEISESELILFLRGQRHYDYLYIYNWNNSFPPEPFPYYSSMTTFIKASNDYDKKNYAAIVDWKKLFYEAFANLNLKLANFYEKNKSIY